MKTVDARKITLVSLGGTIACGPSVGPNGEASAGVVPRLSADDLVESIRPGAPPGLELEAVSLRQVGSSSLRLHDVFDVLNAIRSATSKGSDGVVVTMGTDTLEEMAFLVDILYDGDVPVIFTGAMRDSTRASSDGLANLEGAVATASCEDARGTGVLAVMNDEIHAARWVTKGSTYSVSAFQSPSGSALGRIVEGVPSLTSRPQERLQVTIPRADMDEPQVALIAVGLSDDGRMLDVLPELGFRGAVLIALGGGHVPDRMVPAVERLLEKMPVVLTSRTRCGPVLQGSYSFAGSEIDLGRLGVISGGALDPYKARSLLAILLMDSDNETPPLGDRFTMVANRL